MFSRKTFEYFEGAEKNRRNLKWFGRNRSLYDESVRAPFSELLKNLKEKAGPLFPEIHFSPQKICLPVYRENFPEDGTLVKPFTWAFLSEKRTSLFEWNPGINLYFGEELSFGLGLYHPSSRQMRHIRTAVTENPEVLEKILSRKNLLSTWGELDGERFVRFPAGFDPEGRGADFLWYRQFILKRHLTRKEFYSPALADLITEDLISAAPFLHWLQETVGVYEKPIESVR